MAIYDSFARWRAERALRKGASSRKALLPAPLGPYTRQLWHQRHRSLCLSLLGLFAFLYGFGFALFGRYYLPGLLVPLGILLAFVIWLLPEDEDAPEGLLKPGLFAYIFALLCWPDYIAIDLPGLPWITLIRIIGLPIALLLLTCVSVSPAFRSHAKSILASGDLIWKGVAGFAIIGLVSIGLSHDPADSISRFAVAQINWTAMFFISCIVFVESGTIRRLASSLWLIAVIVCLIGVYENHLQHLPWVGHIPWFLVIQDESVQRALAGTSRAGTSLYRVQSKFTTSLGLAEYLAIATPFVFHFIATGRTLLTRIAAAATVPLIFYIVIATDSRLAAIGLFISLALYLLYWAVMRWKVDRNSLMGPAITIGYPAIFLMLISTTVFISRIRAKVWGDGSQQPSTDARKTMYSEGIPMVLRNPIGHGFGQGATTLGYHNLGGVLTIDTYYLAVALEFGIIGFVVFYGVMILAMWKSAWTALDGLDPESEWLGPFSIALLNFIISKSVFSNLENHPLVFILLGALVSLLYRESKLRGVADPVLQHRSMIQIGLRGRFEKG